ncbi:uncharacterized protein B0I36DRAFT_161379 [Microdochium trichocladiopsis]|uniref:Uncharacterized protein n=1 Tax=Microdochium trichocladiopsis TaxID=1682393 RepID=A0A9P8Y282_9PEZI|nr:uncharacterized protein B0I36DRAFT_161379 [Microdochium trichocladiopsis]KAH7026701.1 hypothetical protein B0I36DRAFT_161379 [Microdochium trichocladiopsis]
MTPYRILNSNPTRASEAVNMNLSTNQFSGLGRSLSFWQGTHDWFLASVAAVALLAEFLPALLSNVPYRVVQTSETHTACVYLSCAVLGLMLLVTCASFLVDWPHMPVDPSTLAGAMYYISPARGGGSGGALVSGHVPAVNTPYSAATTQAYDPPPGAEAGAYIDYTYTNTEALQPIQNSNSDTFHQLPPPAHHQQGVQQEQPTDVTAAAAAAAAAPAPVAVAVTREPSTAPQPASSLYHYEVPPPRT